MKKQTIWIIFGIILLFLFGFIYSNNRTENKEIKIGVILPLTGFLANQGIDTKNAIELAYSDLNVKNIKLIYEDDACDSAKALTAYRKLVDVDKVNYLIGPFCGQSAMAVLDLINKDKIIAISPGAPDNELSKKDYFFRTRVANRDEIKTIVDYILNKNISNVAIYTVKNTFGKSYRDSFVEQLPNYVKIIYDDGSVDYQVDFKTDITKLKQLNPEAIFIITASRQQMGIFVKEAKEINFNPIILGASVTEQQDLIESAGNASNGIIYPYAIPINLDIVNKFKESYGKIPPMEVLNGYDTFNILYNQINECNNDKICVLNKLNNLKDFKGVMGNISFDDNGDTKVDLILKTIKNGEFVKL